MVNTAIKLAISSDLTAPIAPTSSQIQRNKMREKKED